MFHLVLSGVPFSLENIISNPTLRCFFKANGIEALISITIFATGCKQQYSDCTYRIAASGVALNTNKCPDMTLAYSTSDFSKMYMYCSDCDAVKRVFLDYLYKIFRYRLLFVTGIALHGAAIVYNGECIVFSGFSGAGKSTQANLWRKNMRSWVLNYDKPAVIKNKNSYSVYGTPWSGKEVCYIQKSIPLKAIVFVEKSATNKVVLLSMHEAFTLMLFNFMIDPLGQDIQEMYTSNICDLLASVNVYKLYCRNDASAVYALKNEIYRCQKGVTTMRYKRNDSFLLKEIAGEWILIARGELSLKFQATILFNETAVTIWNKLKNVCTEDELVDEVVSSFNVPEEAARRDIQSFISEMLSEKIIHVCEE